MVDVPATSTFRDGFAHIRRRTGIARRPIVKALRSGDLHACIYLGGRGRQLVIVPSAYFAERGGDDFDRSDDGRGISVRLSEILSDLGDALTAVPTFSTSTPNEDTDELRPQAVAADADQEWKPIVDPNHRYREFQFIGASSLPVSRSLVGFDGQLDVAEIQRLLINKADKEFRMHLFDAEIDAFVVDQMGENRRKPGPIAVDLNEAYWFTLIEKIGVKAEKLPNQGRVLDAMEKWCRDPSISSSGRSIDISKTTTGQIQRQLTEVWRILKAPSREE